MITLYCHRWSVFATLLFLFAELGMPCPGDAAQLPPQGRDPNPKAPQAVCIDEHITITARSVPREQVLDGIAKACRLKILTPSAEKTKTLTTVDFNAVELADALGEVLRGCDYLVVYNESRVNTGFVASVAQARTPASQDLPPTGTVAVVADDEPLSPFDEKQAQADYLRGQIETLNERIASGDSDRFYQQALKHKSPEFIHDDRKELALYQRQLAALEQ